MGPFYFHQGITKWSFTSHCSWEGFRLTKVQGIILWRQMAGNMSMAASMRNQSYWQMWSHTNTRVKGGIYIYTHNCIDSTQNIFQKNIFTKRGNILRAWRSSTLRSLSLSSSVPSLNNFGQGYHLSLTRPNVTNLNSLNSWPVSCPTTPVILEDSWGFQIISSFSRNIYTSPLDTITRPDITG